MIASSFPVRRRIDGVDGQKPFSLTWVPSSEHLGGLLVLDDDRTRTAYLMAEMATGAPLFAGDSEIDTIFKIFQKLGTPTEQMWPGVSELPDFKPTFPRWPARGWDAIRNTKAQVGTDGIDLLEKLMTYDPKKRLSARKALQHQYLATADVQD